MATLADAASLVEVQGPSVLIMRSMEKWQVESRGRGACVMLSPLKAADISGDSVWLYLSTEIKCPNSYVLGSRWIYQTQSGSGLIWEWKCNDDRLAPDNIGSKNSCSQLFH